MLPTTPFGTSFRVADDPTRVADPRWPSDNLPRLDASGHNPQHGMRFESRRAQFSELRRIPNAQLLNQVTPLMFHLTLGYRNGNRGSSPSDLGSVKSVTPRSGLVDNAPQIGADRCDRAATCPKSFQLRMKSIAYRLTEEHLLGE